LSGIFWFFLGLSGKFIEQGVGFEEVGGVETFSKPIIDFPKGVVGFLGFALC